MNVQQTNLDVIANNIANVNTNGYKRSRGDFQDLIYQTLRLQGAQTEGGNQVPTGIQIGLGAMLASVQKVFQQGVFQKTEYELDVAIEGNGFIHEAVRCCTRVNVNLNMRISLLKAENGIFYSCRWTYNGA
jgi:flagellar basal-body rod protein FlgG